MHWFPCVSLSLYCKYVLTHLPRPFLLRIGLNRKPVLPQQISNNINNSSMCMENVHDTINKLVIYK